MDLCAHAIIVLYCHRHIQYCECTIYQLVP